MRRVGGLYLLALHLLQHVLWPTEWSGAVGFAILGGVGLAVGLLVTFLGPSGDVELMVDNIHVSGTATGVRMLRSLIPTSLLCVASGGAMGPEAPLVQTTGSLASWTATRAGLRVRESRVLTVTGMAAGFTVLFGAPLGAAVFALELLHRRGLQYYEALLPAVIGSLAGYGVYVAASTAGLEPVWHLPSPDALQLADLGWAVVAGIGGALIAIAFTYSPPRCDGERGEYLLCCAPPPAASYSPRWVSRRRTHSPSARRRSTRSSTSTVRRPRSSPSLRWPSSRAPR